ncbi:MAG TPA: M3 family metallopeptidase, partial [Gammaproteobacteria bacterium]|nr:M3 family metallopeptidase [Gammaproteobacteria bacterium]
MSNPLLSAAELPPFSAIRPEHVEPAIRSSIDRNREKLAALLDAQAATWDDLVVPVEAMQHDLARAWSPVSHLNAVLNSEQLRAAYNTCLPLLAAWNTELAQNERLYRAYSTVREQEAATRDAAELKLLDNALRDFRLAGTGLPLQQKDRFKSLMERLSGLHARFDENVLDATNAWSRHITEERGLSGLPATVRQRARTAATEAGLEGWLFSLDGPNYQAVLMHAEREELRRDFYEAWCTRASDHGSHAGRFDNGPVMTEILAVRRELAALVGFQSFAEYSLATKMAASATEVLGFLDELASV